MTALSWSSQNVHLPLPHNLSFVHVHKCGGTTVKTLLVQAKCAMNQSLTLEHYKYSFGGSSITQKQRNQQRRQTHVDQMVHLQQQRQHPLDSVIFTVIRDPLERFVSAVQQVMHYNTEFRTQCLAWTARATLTCAINQMHDTGYLRDVHLVPMATHLRLWEDHPTARLAVLHLQDLHLLAEYINNVVVTGNHNHGNQTIPHGRDRSNVDYATSWVLAHMSVRQDCTPAMIQQLCHLYAVDVAFLQSIGYSSPYCE
jgi:Sulfotransferase family